MVPTGGRCHASERRNRLSFGSGERSRDLKLYCITRLCGAVRARRGIIPLEKLFFFFFFSPAGEPQACAAAWAASVAESRMLLGHGMLTELQRLDRALIKSVASRSTAREH